MRRVSTAEITEYSGHLRCPTTEISGLVLGPAILITSTTCSENTEHAQETSGNRLRKFFSHERSTTYMYRTSQVPRYQLQKVLSTPGFLRCLPPKYPAYSWSTIRPCNLVPRSTYALKLVPWSVRIEPPGKSGWCSLWGSVLSLWAELYTP